MNAQAQLPTAFDVQRIRADFPLLARSVHGKPLVYFDSANTSQKPQCVIDAGSSNKPMKTAVRTRPVTSPALRIMKSFCGAAMCFS